MLRLEDSRCNECIPSLPKGLNLTATLLKYFVIMMAIVLCFMLCISFTLCYLYVTPLTLNLSGLFVRNSGFQSFLAFTGQCDAMSSTNCIMIFNYLLEM